MRSKRFYNPALQRRSYSLLIWGLTLVSPLTLSAQGTDKRPPMVNPNISAADFGYTLPVKHLNLTRSKIRLAYQEVGQGNEIILLLHDVDANIGYCEPLAKQLGKSFRCLALDLPGHGLSAKTNMAGGLQQWVDCIGQFLDDLNVWSVTIISQGVGANLATLFAYQNPTRVDQLVIISPTTVLKPAAERLPTVLKQYEPAVLRAKTDSMLKKDIADKVYTPWQNMAKLAQPRIMLRSLEGFGFYCNAVQNLAKAAYAQPAIGVAAKVNQPCLVLGGERDTGLAAEAALATTTGGARDYLDQVSKSFPNGAVALISSAGRWPHLEEASATAGEIIAFIKMHK